jgi:hypothetical protein
MIYLIKWFIEHFLLYLFILSILNSNHLIKCQDIHLCKNKVKENALLQCPNPDTFNIENELTKSESEFKLDFLAFKSLGIQSSFSLLNEIKNRYDTQSTCPFIKTTIQNVCCQGWSGPNCTEPICINSCQNNGQCVSPDVCDCVSPYSGEYCQFLESKYFFFVFPKKK